MKVTLLVDQRVKHNAGEIVEVSPEVANFLISINAAKKPEKKEVKKKKATSTEGKNEKNT